ncbi:uncharacterized protein METZ01_LOCUS111656, partial [marine metagenome]
VSLLSANQLPVWAETGDFIEMQKDGIDGVDGIDGARFVTVSADGSHVYAAGTLEHTVAVFSRNASTGVLGFIEAQKDGINGVDGLTGPRSLSISPDGSHLYAGGFDSHTIAVFSRNGSTGGLTYVEMHKDGVNGVDGLSGITSLQVSPDGNHVYATGFSDHALAVFSRNGSTGGLTYVEMHKDGANSVDGLKGAKTVTVSPDGNHVYATGAKDDAIAVFSRDSSTGSLTFVEMHKDGVNGVDGLDGATSITVSHDGAQVYSGGTT